MADHKTCLPLDHKSIIQTHTRIKPHIHRTPVITSRTMDIIASSPDPRLYLSNDPPGVFTTTSTASSPGPSGAPKINLFFKMENMQRIGAFKARGAFSAITHLIEQIGLDKMQERGVITHSSGNHAQALALAASSYGIPGFIVMPKISTQSKISGTKGNPGVEVVFSGSTSVEREEVVEEVIRREEGKKGKGMGPILVPPYDHPDIVLGQGTVGVELEEQYHALKGTERRLCSAAVEGRESTVHADVGPGEETKARLDAVLTPCGGGGLLSGTATYFSHTNSPGSGKKTYVFGAEPSYQGANDCERGLSATPPTRIPHVSSLTIADGVRTPVGSIPWSVISDKSKVEGVYSVNETEIKMALKLMLERVKVVIEPSSAVPIAVVLFNARFRQWVAARQRDQGGEKAWDVGIVISGGNTTVEAVSKLFAGGRIEGEDEKKEEFDKEGQTGEVGLDGSKRVQDVAG